MEDRRKRRRLGAKVSGGRFVYKYIKTPHSGIETECGVLYAHNYLCTIQ